MKTTPQKQTPVYSRYLHLDWVAGEFTCWDLVRLVYRDELRLGLHETSSAFDVFDPRKIVREFIEHPSRKLFTQITEPQHLDVALYKNQHVGVFLTTPDGPRILHNDEHTGVACIPVSEFPEPTTYWRHV